MDYINNLRKYSEKISEFIRKNELDNDIEIENIQQLSLTTIIKPVYNDSKILNFLSFMNSTISIPQNLRIVCHSHIMSSFIKKDLKIEIKENLMDILSENLWTTFITLTNEKKISISRHGYSFANVLKDRKTLQGKIEQGLESDAKLSIYGLLTALLHGTDLVKKEKKNGMLESPDKIFVSILIRTWMTAICLYLPHCKNNFTLIVSPFLKEEGPSFDNQPQSFDEQMLNIKIFLDYLIMISDADLSTTIKNNLKAIKIYFMQNKLIIYARFTNFMSESIRKVEFTLKNNLIEYKTVDLRANYFVKKNNLDKTFKIENLKIFHGEYAPEKNDLHKFTRWCEPFSKKPIGSDVKGLCKIGLKKD